MTEVGSLAKVSCLALLVSTHENLAKSGLFYTGHFLVTLVTKFVSSSSAFQTEYVLAGDLYRKISLRDE